MRIRRSVFVSTCVLVSGREGNQHIGNMIRCSE